MDSLKVPYGLNDSGELISAEYAIKDENYSCPCCKEYLVHRAGEVRAKHFAHPHESSCSIESILHITAKMLVEAAINANSSGLSAITLRNSCHLCGSEFNTSLIANTFTAAGQEVWIGEYRCDVVGYRNNEIALAIEILNTHAVDSGKAKSLQAHWIELNAEDVIANPLQWNPAQSRLKPAYCPECKNHIKRVQSVADKYGIARNLYSPLKTQEASAAAYIADTIECFKCHEEIPVFWWRGVPFCETEPPNPRPKTIKFRNSKQFGGSYWANTCPKCNIIQGDNHLYIFEGAPFNGMPLSDEVARHLGGGVSIRTGGSAASAFMKILGRNIF